jgi:hypothetical protein
MNIVAENCFLDTLAQSGTQTGRKPVIILTGKASDLLVLLYDKTYKPNSVLLYFRTQCR